MPAVYHALTASALALVVPSAAFAQEPVRLGAPLGASSESFSRVAGVRELADGRVLVSDSRERIVHLVDLTRGTTQRVGREGAGPTEYASPGAIFALPGDRSLLVDGRNQRYLIFDADGKPVQTIPLLRISNGGVTLSLGAPSGVDAEGRLYFAQASFSGGTMPDSVALMRWTPGSERADTVGYIRRANGGPVTTRPSGGGVSFSMAAPMAFQPQESWGVSGDGRIARVFPEPYRVGWYGRDRRITSGPAVPYTPLRVTDADREAYRAQQASAPRPTISTTGPDGPRTFSPPPQEPTFAETKPPFWGAGSVLVSPAGEVWVLRTRPAADQVPVYDVFDGSGALRRKVAFPPRGRLVGFGRSGLYVAVTDDDDLEQLRRYPVAP